MLMFAFTETPLPDSTNHLIPRLEVNIFNMNRIKVPITNPSSMQERL